MNPWMIACLIAVFIIACGGSFFLGLYLGIKGIAELQKDEARARDYAEVQKRWAGHTSHKGHTF